MEPRDLSAHATYRAGRGIEEVARELGRDPADFVKLASNENPHGPAPAAIEAIRAGATEVHRYPTASHTDLAERLAAEWDVDPTQVWLGNGGDAALDYLARAMLEPGDHVLVPEPGFAYYAMSARYHHGRVNSYQLDRAAGFPLTADTVLADYDGERIVYLTSPHNPTGATFAPGAVRSVAERTAAETLVLVDEAYGEYADTPSAVEMLEERDDIAILRTFSKAYGLAGLRLGYALVPPAWADAYAKINTPFSASEIACRAGLAALDDTDHVETSVETARWARERLGSELSAPVYESEGNFVLVDVSAVDAGEQETPAGAVAEAALRDGVIVRDCTSFGLPGCIRVTCGTRPDTRRAIEVLNEVFAG
ncbi:MAG: histidinol-phosphate transaminase [Halobacteriaceae archaeon]